MADPGRTVIRIAASLAVFSAISTVGGLIELVLGISQWWLSAAIFVGVPLGAIAAFLAAFLTLNAPVLARLLIAIFAAATLAASSTLLFAVATPYVPLMMCEGLCEWEIAQQQRATATFALWVAFPLLAMIIALVYRARGNGLARTLLVIAVGVPVVQSLAVAAVARTVVMTPRPPTRWRSHSVSPFG